MLMKALVVHTDEMVGERLSRIITENGHEAARITARQEASRYMQDNNTDLLVIDPSPMKISRPLVSDLRRAGYGYRYVLVASGDISAKEALDAGANDAISLPVNPESLVQAVKNADRLITMVNHYGDGSVDFPSAGGVIAKSAFNQLFLSALQQADRYSESSFILVIKVDNHAEIKEHFGSYASGYVAAQLSKALVRVRRQSDIIGQTAAEEFSLLLLRPRDQTEPLEAAKRFAQVLEEQNDFAPDGVEQVDISVNLIRLPSGSSTFERLIRST